MFRSGVEKEQHCVKWNGLNSQCSVFLISFLRAFMFVVFLREVENAGTVNQLRLRNFKAPVQFTKPVK